MDSSSAQSAGLKGDQNQQSGSGTAANQQPAPTRVPAPSGRPMTRHQSAATGTVIADIQLPRIAAEMGKTLEQLALQPGHRHNTGIRGRSSTPSAQRPASAGGASSPIVRSGSPDLARPSFASLDQVRPAGSPARPEPGFHVRSGPSPQVVSQPGFGSSLGSRPGFQPGPQPGLGFSPGPGTGLPPVPGSRSSPQLASALGSGAGLEAEYRQYVVQHTPQAVRPPGPPDSGSGSKGGLAMPVVQPWSIGPAARVEVSTDGHRSDAGPQIQLRVNQPLPGGGGITPGHSSSPPSWAAEPPAQQQAPGSGAADHSHG